MLHGADACGRAMLMTHYSTKGIARTGLTPGQICSSMILATLLAHLQRSQLEAGKRPEKVVYCGILVREGRYSTVR